ncbi:MAG TPA: hypothetical protein PLE19_03295 [Planctomycetota bacterium]|nr:hypothetical protein [Planctomycetota bacterium]HRR79624.1 hypothetical protein [Planctomycetota bacterium]HRT97004.1 hypothetical protein [Planctomycetota bacterium]
MRFVYVCVGLLLTLALAAQGCCSHCRSLRLGSGAAAAEPSASRPLTAQP